MEVDDSCTAEHTTFPREIANLPTFHCSSLARKTEENTGETEALIDFVKGQFMLMKLAAMLLGKASGSKNSIRGRFHTLPSIIYSVETTGISILR